MLKTENTSRVCDICFASPSRVYCRKDLAYLCASCDNRNHAASRHERVSICDSCGSAPAAFLCKADAASLCSACDSEIHSVNPLARRHYRVPAPPIGGGEKLFMCNKEEQDESFGDESWLFGGEDHVDEYLDLDDYKLISGEEHDYDHHHQQHFSSTVSVPQKSYYDVCDMNYLINGNDHYCSEYEGSNSGNYCPDNNSFMSHSISLSSMDVGVVPESATSQVSISHHHNNNRPPKGITELFAGNQIPIPTQLTPMDREARVLRYREKKKTRKFEKTIRYASRKAYAETRPRIKGRFTKTKDGESEVDQMFCTSLMETESVYGVVPSF